MRRNHLDKQSVTVIVFLLVVSIMVGITGCTNNDNSYEEQNSFVSSKSESNESEADDISSVEVTIYANDPVVNQFIIDYNAITTSAFTDISKGNIKTKYMAYSYGYYLELLDANDTGKIAVTINKTNDNANVGVSGMKEVFHDVAKSIDSSLSDDGINSYFDQLVSNTMMVENDTLGTIKVTFIPDAKLSNGYSRGHIELSEQ